MAQGVVLDALDAKAVREAVGAARPDAIVYQATPLDGLSHFKHFDRVPDRRRRVPGRQTHEPELAFAERSRIKEETMVAPILVTGGTGRLGRHVVPRLRGAGCDVRVLSRRSREGGEGIEFATGDLATGEGIKAAVQGTEIIVHCASSAKGDEVKARRLVRAASRAGPRHLVFISVVGADRIPLFGSKLAAERVVADSGVPWTTLRATVFHDLMLLTLRQMARLPVIPVPAGFRAQPIDPAEVAARLVELALGAPAGLAPDMGGPRLYELAELLRGYLRARRKHRPILPVQLPGKSARAFRAGANLAPDRAVGRRTWEDFVAARVSSPIDSRSGRT